MHNHTALLGKSDPKTGIMCVNEWQSEVPNRELIIIMTFNFMPWLHRQHVLL